MNGMEHEQQELIDRVKLDIKHVQSLICSNETDKQKRLVELSDAATICALTAEAIARLEQIERAAD